VRGGGGWREVRSEEERRGRRMEWRRVKRRAERRRGVRWSEEEQRG